MDPLSFPQVGTTHRTCPTSGDAEHLRAGPHFTGRVTDLGPGHPAARQGPQGTAPVQFVVHRTVGDRGVGHADQSRGAAGTPSDT